MPCKFKCLNCKECVYLAEVHAKNTSYPCLNCNAPNLLTGSFLGFEYINDTELHLAGISAISSSSTSQLLCPNCEKPQNFNAVFCKDCGTEIYPKRTVSMAYCDKCESEYDESNKFCEKDGNKLIHKKVIDDFLENHELTDGVDEKPQSISKLDRFNEIYLPMRWYSFITYFLLPISFVINLFLATSIDNESFTTSFFIDAVFVSILIYGLYKKTSWSWQLLILAFILKFAISGIDKVADIGILSYLIVVAIMNIIITYPNYIYFNKRKHLFVN